MNKPVKDTLKLKKTDKTEKVYYKLVRDGQYFQVEAITVVDNEVIKTEITDPNFLQIAFDQIRKKIVMEHYQ